jgi:hypothetical protein
MYHDVPKKKQACRSCHLSMRGYVYDRVTDDFLVPTVPFALDHYLPGLQSLLLLAPSLRLTWDDFNLHYRLIHQRRL